MCWPTTQRLPQKRIYITGVLMNKLHAKHPYLCDVEETKKKQRLPSRIEFIYRRTSATTDSLVEVI